jgi:multicomponent Na+:H+ antiporter subunit E
VKRTLSLAFILAVFWIINSGYFEGPLLGLGLVSVILVVLITLRMQAVDGEYEPPMLLSFRLPFYLLWLAREIVKANIDVVRRIWQRSPDITPTVIKVTASQKTDACKVIYANSITLTPGTITLDVQDDVFEVHALTRDAAEELQKGEMDRRVRALED